MKTLVIPDVHNRIGLAERIALDFGADCDSVVFLGDYFDDFNDTPVDAAETAEWLVRSMSYKNRVHLLGNHDITYLVSSIYTCSGYTWKKKDEIQHIFKAKKWSLNIGENIKLYHWVGDVLLTHAGLSQHFWEKISGQKEFDKKMFEKIMGEAQGALERREFHPVLSAGYARRGRQQFGGILWNDYNDEFMPISGLSQIFAHTPDYSPRQSQCSENYCIDTLLLYAAVIEDGKINIINADCYNQEL
jgi:hypothetical protein